MKYLYRMHANGVGTWRIWNEGSIIHIAHATVIGGSEVLHKEVVPEGLAGRTLDQQIRSRIDSRISRMRDKGYKDSVNEAEHSGSNQLGLERPMLAQSIDKVQRIDYKGAVLQKKLNGHRCLITRQDGEVIAYSRQGKRIDSITHVLEALSSRLPEGETLDGELYCHGVPLQTLASWIKASQPNTKKLSFVCYDIISAERYVDRHAELSGILDKADTGEFGKIFALPYNPYTGRPEMYDQLHRVRSTGFEGLMLRLDGRGYEVGKRSSALLKVKYFHDAEFKCIDIEPSADDWGICVCLAENGKIFRTSAPGTHAEKRNALVNKSEYIGRLLTIEYSELTIEGLPFHASAKCWRDEDL